MSMAQNMVILTTRCGCEKIMFMSSEFVKNEFVLPLKMREKSGWVKPEKTFSLDDVEELMENRVFKFYSEETWGVDGGDLKVLRYMEE